MSVKIKMTCIFAGIHAVWFIRDTSIKDIVKSLDKLRDTLIRGLLVHTQLRDTALPKVSVLV